MNIVSIIKRDILAPIGYRLAGMSIRRQQEYQDFLLRFERMSRRSVEQHQVENLRRLLMHCGEKIPYYMRLFRDLNFDPRMIETVYDIKRLPHLTKSKVRANLDAMTLANSGDLELGATGGTSGRPFKFYVDRRARDIGYASTWRFYDYTGFERGILQAYFWGNAEDYRRSKKLKGRAKNFIENRLYFNSYNINQASMARYYNRLQKSREYAIIGFPSSIYFFAKYLLKNNSGLKVPQAILTTGEKLYDYQRELIEKCFRQKVFSYYGCQEFGVMGCECENHDGFHLDEANMIFEIEETRNESTGKGRLLVTSLVSYGMPFIRYVLDDVGELSVRGCSCGRTSARLVNLEGRIMEFVVDGESNIINPIFFADVFEFEDGIAQYRVYQQKKGEVEVSIVKSERYSEADFQQMRQRIAGLLGSRLRVEYVFVDHIPISPSGKFQPVKSEIASQYL